MRREPTLLFRCTGMEKEKNAFSYAEKYVAARYVTDLLKAEKRRVKPTGFFQIFDIQTGFQDRNGEFGFHIPK
jgi:hypothetical protein